MTITGQSSLGKEDIERMVKDAEAHAEDDRRRKEEAEVRNNADSLVYQIEKLVREQGEKIPGEEKTRLEAALAELKTSIGGTDIDAIKRATESLATASQTATQKLYEAAAANAGGGSGTSDAGSSGGSGSSASNDDDVIDAEIVDEK